jgi:CelD/BcsL family acetyltransferase involved in cellulose biosynthesis
MIPDTKPFETNFLSFFSLLMLRIIIENRARPMPAHCLGVGKEPYIKRDKSITKTVLSFLIGNPMLPGILSRHSRLSREEREKRKPFEHAKIIRGSQETTVLPENLKAMAAHINTVKVDMSIVKGAL